MTVFDIKKDTKLAKTFVLVKQMIFLGGASDTFSDLYAHNCPAEYPVFRVFGIQM